MTEDDFFALVEPFQDDTLFAARVAAALWHAGTLTESLGNAAQEERTAKIGGDGPLGRATSVVASNSGWSELLGWKLVPSAMCPT
ncbi:hypothetical protein [Nocardia sp. NPDC046763]|uniref:hypothetical protein n=1 Tax=Nocardia sp. NPDC046763 TaxID=3155256 RepID=UPI0034000929